MSNEKKKKNELLIDMKKHRKNFLKLRSVSNFNCIKILT